MKLFMFLLGIVIGAGAIFLYDKFFAEDKLVEKAEPLNTEPLNTQSQIAKINYGDPGFANLLDSTRARLYLKTYEGLYQRRNQDTLTNAVWFSKHVIHYMDSVLWNSHMDGIRIYIGAYDRNVAGSHQKFVNQISLFVVPTRAHPGGKHKDDWNFFRLPTTAVINHGELCPNNCN